MRLASIWVVVAVALSSVPARAASILFVSDSMTDTNIPTALMADGHTVTTVTGDYATGNMTLRGDLSGYDAVFWSATGPGGGADHTDAAIFTARRRWSASSVLSFEPETTTAAAAPSQLAEHIGRVFG